MKNDEQTIKVGKVVAYDAEVKVGYIDREAIKKELDEDVISLPPVKGINATLEAILEDRPPLDCHPERVVMDYDPDTSWFRKYDKLDSQRNEHWKRGSNWYPEPPHGDGKVRKELKETIGAFKRFSEGL